jgi:hypothetical protein
MFAKTESTVAPAFLEAEEMISWAAKKQPGADPEPDEDDLATLDDAVDDDLDDDLDDDELDDDDLDDDELDDEDDDDLDDLDDEIDDDLIELDDEYDKTEEEKHRPAHPGKYDD